MRYHAPRAYARVALPNEASEVLHRKLGYRRLGVWTEVGRKFDRYWDVAWYEKCLGAD
jgi:phosphinothricin acetyltransferase